jgi:hypothetical protein
MQLTRRAVIQGFVSAIATVAVGMRVASKMPPIDLKDAIDTFRWEFATDNYFYGLDLARPWDVTIMRRIAGDDWEDVAAKDLMQICADSIVSVKKEIAVRDVDNNFTLDHDSIKYPKWQMPHITYQEIEEQGVAPEGEEEFEAAAVIAMSQGMAALQVDGHGAHAWPEDYYEQTSIDVVRVPEISTTEEELFKHG